MAPTKDTHTGSTRGARRTTYTSNESNRNTGTPKLLQIIPRGTRLFNGDEGSSEEEDKNERESGDSRRVNRPPSRREDSRSSPAEGPGHISKGDDKEISAKREKLKRKCFMLELGLKMLRTNLREYIRTDNLQLVVVRQEACKESLRNFNALNEESYFDASFGHCLK